MTSSVVFFSVFALALVVNIALHFHLRYWQQKLREAEEEERRLEEMLKERRERKGW